MGLMKTTGRKVDYKKEGRWRKARPEDKKFKAQYVLEYQGEVYSVGEFISKFCPEARSKHILARKYPPAELIVRYNAHHKPIHIPDVDYVWGDLLKYTIKPNTKKRLLQLAKSQRKKGKKKLPKKVLVV